MNRTMSYLAPALLLPLVATANGQLLGDRPVQAPSGVLQAFGLRAATVQRLEAPENLNRSFRRRLVLGGKAYTIDVHPHSLLAPNFKLLVDDGQSIREIASPPDNSFQGTVVGVADSAVAATVWNGQLWAQVHIGDATWTVQPASDLVKTAKADEHVVCTQRDVIFPKGFCGTTATIHDGGAKRSGPTASALQACEIAIDCDWEYYRLNGSSTTKTQNAARAIMNATDVIYRRDLDICYTVTTILVRTSKVYRNGPNVGCSGSGLLQEMGVRWNANHKGIKRDLAHMFTGWGSFSGTIGCASVGVVCSQTQGYGVSRTKGSLAANTGLVAHEIGHNWSASHCSGSSCYIMCASLSGCGTGLRFGPQAKGEIGRHKSTRTCLGTCGGCRNEADYTYFGKGCAGTGRGTGPGCILKNWNQSLNGAGYGRLDAAIVANTGGAARTIVSIDFYCSAGSAFNLPVQIFARASGGGPGTQLGSAMMRVGTSNASHRATFNPPITLGANTPFLIGFSSPQSPFFSAPLARTGSDEDWWLKQGSRWFQSSRKEKWNYRVNCIGVGATPILGTSGKPQLNKSYQITVSKARPSSICVLFHSARAIAVDLSGAGATGCSLYVDLPAVFILEGGATNGAGTASFTQYIPNAAALCGVRFFHQIVVNDTPANRLNWVLTRRGQPLIGN